MCLNHPWHQRLLALPWNQGILLLHKTGQGHLCLLHKGPSPTFLDETKNKNDSPILPLTYVTVLAQCMPDAVQDHYVLKKLFVVLEEKFIFIIFFNVHCSVGDLQSLERLLVDQPNIPNEEGK